MFSWVEVNDIRIISSVNIWVRGLNVIIDDNGIVFIYFNLIV